MLYLFIVLNCVASAVPAITAVYGELVSLAIGTCTWFYERLYCTYGDIYCFTSYDKCTYCKSLWVKSSAKCPKCKCKLYTTTNTETRPQNTETQPQNTEPQTTDTQPLILKNKPQNTDTQPQTTETQPLLLKNKPQNTEPQSTDTQPQTTETQPRILKQNHRILNRRILNLRILKQNFRIQTNNPRTTQLRCVWEVGQVLLPSRLGRPVKHG